MGYHSILADNLLQRVQIMMHIHMEIVPISIQEVGDIVNVT